MPQGTTGLVLPSRVFLGAASQRRNACPEHRRRAERPAEHTAGALAPLDPGYIKGYPPGIRENGGQYTHAAIWSVIAFAMLGDGDKAGELFSLLNPINHASTRAAVHRYKVEPYVVCADVYAEPPHVGRGGWTWYTGSAGWMYRAGLEWILGFRVRGATLLLDPCVPQGVARLRDRLPLPLRALRHRGREPARRQPWRHPRGARRRGAAGAPERRFRWRTTARPTGCVSSSDERAPSLASRRFVSTTEDQLRTAIDTEYGLVPPRRGVLGLAARLSANTRVHDTATLRAVADGRVRPSMIHVVAWVGHPESSHHAPASLCASASRCPSRTWAQKRARAALRRLSS